MLRKVSDGPNMCVFEKITDDYHEGNTSMMLTKNYSVLYLEPSVRLSFVSKKGITPFSS